MLSTVRAELTKILTLRSTWIYFGIIVSLHILIEWQALSLYTDAVSKIAPDGTIEIFTGEREPAVPALIEGLIGSSLQMSVFLPVLAAVIAGQEFRGRQFGASVLAVPRRGRLLAAKLLAATVFLLLPAMAIVTISTTSTYLAVRAWKPGFPFTTAALRGDAGFVAYAILLCLTTFSITLATRSVLGAILLNVALSATTLTQVFANAPALDSMLPVSAGRNLLFDVAGGGLTTVPMQPVTVLICWTLGTALVAGLGLTLRDTR